MAEQGGRRAVEDDMQYVPVVLGAEATTPSPGRTRTTSEPPPSATAYRSS